MSRVIGGASGGRRLATPSGRGTRPTSDRVREALFSSLVSLFGDLAGVAFLDLYAGSGAVGLEAASRGAAPVTLVEQDAGAVRVIRQNLAAVDARDVEVVAAPVGRFLAGLSRSFQAVFLDPPYAEPVDETLVALADGWLAADAVVCVERASRDAAMRWPAGLSPLRSRRYGDTTLWYGRAS
jgi:16S rRNA (guanine966-N2)-methyltransferase